MDQQRQVPVSGGMNQFDLFDGEEPLFTASGEIRTCIKCETTLPIEFFDIDAYHANGDVRRRPECTDCRKKARMQTAKLKKVTAPPPDDHVCPVCLRDKDGIKGTDHKSHNSWCLDHNHDTGMFRGWLCHQCNRMLGMAKDNVATLRRAITYLEGDAGEK